MSVMSVMMIQRVKTHPPSTTTTRTDEKKKKKNQATLPFT
jgi:hypothetical protein